MFFQIFKYRIKCMLGDKGGTFWMVAFPLLMSVLFYLCFQNIGDTKVEDIPVTVIGENAEFMTAAEGSGLFTFVEADEQNAKQKLDAGEIDAIITLDDTITIELATNGIYQSITKFFLDTYIQRTSTIVNIVSENPAVLTNGFMDTLDEQREFSEEVPMNGNNMNVVVIYFYALIAMTVIMCGTLSIDNISNIQANQSDLACRNAVAPTNKLKSFTAMSAATMVFHFASTMLLFVVLKFVYNIDFGERIGLVILTAFVGCFAGIMFGALISAIVKKSTGIKLAIILSFSIFGAFCGGLMSSDIKYMITSYCPILNYIMMPALVSDSLYVLYFYESLDRYFLNMGILAAIGVVCCAATYLVLSKQRFKSL